MTDAEGNEIGKLFVGGLSQATNNGSLRLYFSRFGEVDDAVVMMDNKTGRSRGFGYVKYREPESVNLALEAKPHILDGKEVDAKQCNVNMKGRNRRSLKIFVGGIGLDQDADSIKNYFRQFGRVTDVNLMMDSNKQRHRGFAFVGFEDEAVVKRLINLHYVTMNNKQVEIKAMEPPNFGRKMGASTCLTTAALMASAASAENGCGHSFESNPDTNSLLMGGLSGLATGGQYTTHTNPYLSTPMPNLQCMQHNILGQTRSTPPNSYENQNSSYGSGLMPENIYSSTAYIQTVPVTQFTPRAADVLPSGTVNNPYMTQKQPVPLIITNGQYSQGSSLATNGLGTFGQNSSSLYATIPCHLVQPQFIANPHQSAVGNISQLISPEKPWASTTVQPTHLTICPSQISPQTSFLACPPFAGNPPVPSSGLQSDSAAPTMFTPYYALCPQYTSFPLQTDISGSNVYNTVQTTPCPSAIMGPGATNGNATATTTGSGDSAIVQIASSSRPTSPISESKTELNTPNKLVYPTLLMTATNGLQNPTMVASASSALNIGQTMWNHPTSNLLYSPLSVAWTVHPGNQAGHSNQWPSTLTVLPQQATNTNGTNTVQQNNLTSANSDGLSQLTHGTRGSKENTSDSKQVTPTRASGDNLDGLITTGIQNEQRNSPHNYRNSKTQKESAISVPENQRSVSRLSDISNWTMTGSNANCPGTTPGTAWQNTAIPITRWNELSDETGPTTLNSNSSPWALSMDLVDKSISCIQPSVNENLPTTHSNNSLGSSSKRTTDSHGNTKPPCNARPSNQTDSAKPCVDSSKCEARVQLPLSSGFAKISQRLSNYQSHHKSGTENLTSPDKQTITTMQSNVVTSGNLTTKAKSAFCGGNNSTGMGVGTTESRTSDHRMDYTSWLYQNTSRSCHFEDNTGDRKEIQTTNSVELECQGPAGAAGDYHHPVHTGHFTSYQMTR